MRQPPLFPGDRFGRLVTIEDMGHIPTSSGTLTPDRYWRCRCDCGNERVIPVNNLRKGMSQSCGCLQREKAAQVRTSHGESRSRLYSIWKTMKNRCLNPNVRCWGYYGGRGVTVCSAWIESFESFRDWAMSHGYDAQLTLDRINANGNYEPDNCRWATWLEQRHNRRPVTHEHAV